VTDNLRIIKRGVFSTGTFDEAAKEKPEKPIALKDNLIFTTVQPVKAVLSPIASASMTVPLTRPSPSIKAEEIRFIDPLMASKISTIVYPPIVGIPIVGTPIVGIPREKLTCPISPSTDVTDELIFEDPPDQAKKLYLPRYRVSEQNISGSQQFKISLEKAGNGWSLTIYLDKYPAPKIEVESRGASELAHQVAVLLRYHIKGSDGALKELSFQEVTVEQSGLKIVLNLDSLAERDEIYRAMTEDDFQSALIVRRVFRVAIPAGQSDGGTSSRIISSGISTIRETRKNTNILILVTSPWGIGILKLSGSTLNAPLTAPNGTKFGEWLFSTADDILGPVGDFDGDGHDEVLIMSPWGIGILKLAGSTLDAPLKAPNGTRFGGWLLNTADNHFGPVGDFDGDGHDEVLITSPWGIGIQKLSGSTLDAPMMAPNGTSFGGWLLSTADDHIGPVGDFDGSSPGTGVPIFREVTRALDDVPEPHPFSFPPNLHPYIFHDITPTTSEGSGLVHLQVDSFSYYQDSVQPYVFYYLPDSFKIARKPDAPHTPIMSVKFESENSVKLAYFAMPYADTGRLNNALDKLKQNPSFLAAQLPQGISSPLLQPLQIDPNKTKFYLGIPGQEDSSGPFQDRSKNVLINITIGITDELALNLEGLQEIFNSIFGGPTLIFQGKVEAEVYADKIETIPFIARMNDMAGSILDYKEEQDSGSGGVRATFVNAIESPVRINSLGAKIVRGNSSSRGEIRGPSLPFQLKPGESIQFIVAPLEQLSEDGQARAVFDPFSLDVLPNSGAIWDSILNKSVPSKPREITIKTPVFRDPDASKDLLEFIVEFKSGKTIELTPDQDTVKTTLPLTPEDLRNLVLGNPDQNTPVYHVTAVSKDNHLTRGPDKTLDGNTIIVIGVN
jgi:hypothetical protein